MFKSLSKIIGIEAKTIPNKFTFGMGSIIKEARLEQKMTQVELAQKAFFHQGSISDIEKGKRELSSSDLISFSFALNKPISYFFPVPYNEAFMQEHSDQLAHELLMVTRQMSQIEMKRLIAQARVLADFTDE